MHSSLFNYRNVPVIIGVDGASEVQPFTSTNTVSIQYEFWCTVVLTTILAVLIPADNINPTTTTKYV